VKLGQNSEEKEQVKNAPKREGNMVPCGGKGAAWVGPSPGEGQGGKNGKKGGGSMTIPEKVGGVNPRKLQGSFCGARRKK